MSSKRRFTDQAQSRRWFMKTAAIGGGATLLGTLPFNNAFAAFPPSQVQFANTALAKSAAEADLDLLAATHPELHKIATDLLAHLKYTFTVAASGQGGGSENELVNASRTFIATRKSKAQAGYLRSANRMLAAPEATRQAHFGRYAAILPATFISLDHAAASAKVGGPVLKKGSLRLENIKSLQLAGLAGNPKDTRTMQEIAKEIEDEKKAQDIAADKEAGRKFTKLEFFISEVRCKASTNDQMGDDEIHMGGLAVGATGYHHTVKQWSVDEDMDPTVPKHNVRAYSGGKQFAPYAIDTSISKPDPFPHVYTATVALAEIDCGGFNDFLTSMWKKLGPAIASMLGDAAAGAIAGELIPIPGLGLVLGALIGSLIGYLISLTEDDVLGMVTSHFWLHNFTHSYYANYEKQGLLKSYLKASQTGIARTLHFRNQGSYEVTGGWRLINPS
jgi:hypothetical protein